MTEKTLAELRAETDRLMRRPIHMHHEARIAALAAERDAADFEIERLIHELDEARAEAEMLRATRELDEALAEAERLLAVAQLGEGEAKRCAWTYDETHFAWGSSCGEKWVLMDGGLIENEIRFCHGCGKLVEIACKATPEQARPA